MPLSFDPPALTDLGATLNAGPHTEVHRQVNNALRKAQAYINTMESTMTANGWVTSARIAPGAVNTTHIGTLDASVIKTGSLPVARGGTGQTSHSNGRILYGAGTAPVGSIHPNDLRNAIGVRTGAINFTFSGQPPAPDISVPLTLFYAGETILWATWTFLDALGHGPIVAHANPPNPDGGMTFQAILTRGGSFTGAVPARFLAIVMVGSIG